MHERMSRAGAKALNRELAALRKKEPALTRQELLVRKGFNELNRGEKDVVPVSAQADFCKIALKRCPDTNSIYKIIDACNYCPAYIAAREERDFEKSLQNPL